MKLSLLTLSAAIFPFLLVSASNIPEIDDGYEYVTCGSIIKLTNKASEYKLHSHGVSYGSGSGQQSVTGFPEADDSNSFWIVEAAYGKVCKRGEAVPCGSSIRLKHVNTQGYLHSHRHQSPLSREQEVSCYDGKDKGDNWQLKCKNEFWIREEPVQFVHEDTHLFLSSSPNHKFGQPIPGQLEVSASTKGSSKSTQWTAQEGIYFAANRSK
ncbi:mannosyltransferase [Cokeromyces recurvatus]|uniref:mannosyltransferase n=1 Tax=Cokeromyces recurvatus TaxID=90255 RepID=UPI002220537B|nr:mannosyltransferase [Cokeromyces recurvatus]KAI7900602.1 mannosyltransferase [Cokeromyces recurvatus]